MKSKIILLAVLLHIVFTAGIFGQKYQSGTRLLKGAEVMSATPLQLDYVLETLADTAKITVNLHEGKTHLVLDDGSGKWREWWYYMGKWQVKSNADNAGGTYTLPTATATTLGGVKVAADSDINVDEKGFITTKYKTKEIHLNTVDGNDSNDGSSRTPVKSLTQALYLTGTEGTVVIADRTAEIYIPHSDPLFILINKKITISIARDTTIKKVYFGNNRYDTSKIMLINSTLTIKNYSANGYAGRADQTPLVDFYLHSLRAYISDVNITGNFIPTMIESDNSRIFISNKLGGKTSNGGNMNAMILFNCLIKCSEYDSGNRIGTNIGTLILVGSGVINLSN